MQITIRTLLASIAASAVFGGAVGALSTAASTSQANPQSIAAAILKVQDQTAARYLLSINKNTYATCYATIVGARQPLPSCSPAP